MPCVGLYLTADAKDSVEVKYGQMKRVALDSFAWIDEDTVTQVRRWTRDSFYLIPLDVPVDSAIAKQYNVPLLKDGKQNVVRFDIITEKKFVRSGWGRTDSAAAELKRLSVELKRVKR